MEPIHPQFQLSHIQSSQSFSTTPAIPNQAGEALSNQNNPVAPEEYETRQALFATEQQLPAVPDLAQGAGEIFQASLASLDRETLLDKPAPGDLCRSLGTAIHDLQSTARGTIESFADNHYKYLGEPISKTVLKATGIANIAGDVISGLVPIYGDTIGIITDGVDAEATMMVGDFKRMVNSSLFINYQAPAIAADLISKELQIAGDMLDDPEHAVPILLEGQLNAVKELTAENEETLKHLAFQSGLTETLGGLGKGVEFLGSVAGYIPVIGDTIQLATDALGPANALLAASAPQLERLGEPLAHLPTALAEIVADLGEDVLETVFEYQSDTQK